MVKNIFNKKTVILLIVLLSAVAAAFSANMTYGFADSVITGADGVYSVSVDLSGLTMGSDNFSSTAKVEKETTEFGTYYYMTFGHSSSVSSLTLNMGGKQAGFTSYKSGSWTYYTYTLSESNIQKSLSFSAYINAMKRNVSFSVKLSLSSASRTGDYSYDGERPAEFVPVITTSAGSEYQMQQGISFPVPEATATLGSEECDLSVSAYYVSADGKLDVTVENNAFMLENVGEYHLIYTASSATYKTSLGNDSVTVYDVTVISSVGGSTFADFTYDGDVIPEGTALMPSRITEGSAAYTLAAAKMKTIADNFEVFGINLISSDGSEVTANGSFTLYLKADSTFDRSKIVVYHMDANGKLTRLNASGYGRYVKVETELTGTYIVCIPGVAFVMPMWGYALILAGCVVIIAAAVTVTVILVKRKKKKNRRQIAEITEET